MKKVTLHLVSDSTGETVSSMARAVLVQLEGVEAEEHIWSLVRTPKQMERVIEGISKHPGPVLYTVVNDALQEQLRMACLEMAIPCIPVLLRTIRELSAYWGVRTNSRVGRQHELDEDYFERVEAVNFALAHDDGQTHWNLEEADVVLVGCSRTSKSPTCFYLAHRGFYAANIPFVPGVPLPEGVFTAKKPLIVGLIINPENLVQIRKNRLLSLNESKETSYVEEETVRLEVTESRKLYRKMGWPVIDVSRRSVEETAAAIIQLIQDRQERLREEREQAPL
jgi:regulator of PEP synthase PpsR (kinase-PPPase family)